MTEIYKGKIVQLAGSWGSGLAALTVEDERRGLTVLHWDNGPTVRALDAAFGDVIDRNHTFDNAAIRDKEIYYFMDEFGLCLGGFIPVEEASEELIDAYESQGGAT
jgi:hypothetical protein